MELTVHTADPYFTETLLRELADFSLRFQGLGRRRGRIVIEVKAAAADCDVRGDYHFLEPMRSRPHRWLRRLLNRPDAHSVRLHRRADSSDLGLVLTFFHEMRHLYQTVTGRLENRDGDIRYDGITYKDGHEYRNMSLDEFRAKPWEADAYASAEEQLRAWMPGCPLAEEIIGRRREGLPDLAEPAIAADYYYWPGGELPPRLNSTNERN